MLILVDIMTHLACAKNRHPADLAFKANTFVRRALIDQFKLHSKLV
jgi:hypothetical protein